MKDNNLTKKKKFYLICKMKWKIWNIAIKEIKIIDHIIFKYNFYN